ncbi:MAG: hypothetical protein QW369_06345 [Desulfurococcaceae archaeon]
MRKSENFKKHCAMCGAEAVYVCSKCGRPACRQHYSLLKNLCNVCESLLCEICGRNLSIGYCINCGRVGCEDCLVQLSTISYICVECFKSRRESS